MGREWISFSHPLSSPPTAHPPDVLSSPCEVLGPDCGGEGERGKGAVSRGRARSVRGRGAQWAAWEPGPRSEGNHRICGVQVGGAAWISEHHAQGTGHENLDLKVGTPATLCPSSLPPFKRYSLSPHSGRALCGGGETAVSTEGEALPAAFLDEGTGNRTAMARECRRAVRRDKAVKGLTRL